MTSARRGSTVTRFAAAVVLGVLATVPLGLVVAALAPTAASAATYRYWTYWWGRPAKTAWQFASLGPASDVPGDGWVLGWRFGTTNASGTGGLPPRTSYTYADLCGDPTVEAGRIRVAVVVDYGSTADAPPGESPPGGGSARVECVSIAQGAHGFAAMSAAKLDVRVGNQGFVCGLDGYPRTECAAVVAAPATSPAPPAPTVPSAPPPAGSATPTRSSSAPAMTAPRSDASASGSRSVAATSSSSAQPSRTSATSTPSTTPTTAATSAATTAAASAAGSADPSGSGTAVPLAEPTLPVSSGTPVAAAESSPDSGGSLGFVGGAALVAAVGAGAWWTSRRGGRA